VALDAWKSRKALQEKNNLFPMEVDENFSSSNHQELFLKISSQLALLPQQQQEEIILDHHDGEFDSDIGIDVEDDDNFAEDADVENDG
jgi:DNA-directed RNA polymerase specialized sigma24 family protein